MNLLQDINKINFEKMNGLVPAVIQDNSTLKVLMLGFMDAEAVKKTVETGRVTFYSRTKKRLWTKGEESGNFLEVVRILIDCDDDTLLIMVNPSGPVCHTGADTCFFEDNKVQELQFLSYLQDFIDKRKSEMPEGSYTTSLFEKGAAKITRKVGEEALETIIGALTNDDENFLYESADLLYHLIVLLSYKGYRIEDIVRELKKRHK
jgi:phosphoribosyl-AMP cyclohydrolase / phosphoribosyl-ATP pyrophosphohydrolase